MRCPSHNKRVFFYFNCRMFWWLIYGADANTIDYVVRPYTCMYVWYYSYFTPRSSSLFQSISQIFVYFIFLWSNPFTPAFIYPCYFWRVWLLAMLMASPQAYYHQVIQFEGFSIILVEISLMIAFKAYYHTSLLWKLILHGLIANRGK